MSVPYIPFELLNLPLLKTLLGKNNHFLVIQRLQWPGVPDKKGFIATPYQQRKPASEHAQKLDYNVGRMVDLETELDKILTLIDSPRYILYLSTYRDQDWQNKILSHYQKNMQLNLEKYASVQTIDEADIEFCFESGKLMAKIQIREAVQTFSFYDLIK